MSRYENYAIKNNVFGTLSAPISSLATTIQLNSGQGARFSTNQLATLEHTEDNKVKKREIVKITNISGDNLTVVRKFAPCPIDDDANTQSQTSFSFDTSDIISVYITAEHFDNIENGFTNAETELDGLNYDGNARMKVIKAISGTVLKIDIVAGVYRCGQDTVQFVGQSDISVSDNATNYVMIDGAGTVQISTSSRDTRYTRLAEVVCSGGVITSISDWRSDVVGGTLGGLEIHSLTEKIRPVNNDELVLADSEDSFVNKRIKAINLLKTNILAQVLKIPVCIGSSYTMGWSSDDYYIPNRAKSLVYVGNEFGFSNISKGLSSIVSDIGQSGSFNIQNVLFHKGYLYVLIYTGQQHYMARCPVNGLSIGTATLLWTITGSTYIYGMDDTYFYGNMSNTVVKIDYSGNITNLGTFDTTKTLLAYGSYFNGKFYIRTNDKYICRFNVDGSDDNGGLGYLHEAYSNNVIATRGHGLYLISVLQYGYYNNKSFDKILDMNLD